MLVPFWPIIVTKPQFKEIFDLVPQKRSDPLSVVASSVIVLKCRSLQQRRMKHRFSLGTEIKINKNRNKQENQMGSVRVKLGSEKIKIKIKFRNFFVILSI